MTTDQETNEGGNSVYCAHCGTENVKDAHSCDRCGEKIYFPDPQKPPPLGLVECQTCLTSNETRATYCVNCGNSLENAARISVLGGTEGIRQVPHSRPGGIRISQRGREPAARQPESPRSPVNERETAAVPPRAKRVRNLELEQQQRDAARAKAAEQERQRAEEEDGPNNSGTRSAKLPRSARGWNTAAFLIGPIWGPANGVWLGLVGLVFLVIPESAVPLGWKLGLYLTYGIFLGYRGNEMAWRARRWASLDHFKRVQQQWMLLALVVNLALLVLIPILLG